jgi:hypothetical protein
MYAISHASTALLMERRFPRTGLWALLIAVQAIELMWVLLTYTGVEHIAVTDGQIHLGFLPYSHSIGSTIVVAIIAWAITRVVSGDKSAAAAIGLAVLSHIILDLIQHEPDIRLLPFSWGPALGLSLTRHPLADAAIEAMYCVLCWKVFDGSGWLLASILFLNALDLPFMFTDANRAQPVAAHPEVLTSVVLAQILLSWFVVWFLAQRQARHRAHLAR